ncbi:hypothetical protein [Neorhodopirellula pilleata]|uniref:Uncharacterized protein n=1 Tax=Neorhodopirellula pilleata TaxID=2714738 RepID=A0A5C6A8N6_9BACT|nr:hypothetical protein [Neorhodopirellula pilleata]TWT95757.1 hypothetical protein Pla100_33990 [Neorhodopirellula pilleata]
MHKAWSDICRAKNQRRAIASVVGRLWVTFGGSSGIASAWVDAMKDASVARRVRGFESVAVMVKWLAENPEVVTNAGTLTDAELAAEATNARAGAFVELLQSDPATAADLAQRCGFELSRLDG